MSVRQHIYIGDVPRRIPVTSVGAADYTGRVPPNQSAGRRGGPSEVERRCGQLPIEFQRIAESYDDQQTGDAKGCTQPVASLVYWVNRLPRI
jgi:hypothetical protein